MSTTRGLRVSFLSYCRKNDCHFCRLVPQVFGESSSASHPAHHSAATAEKKASSAAASNAFAEAAAFAREADQPPASVNYPPASVNYPPASVNARRHLSTTRRHPSTSRRHPSNIRRCMGSGRRAGGSARPRRRAGGSRPAAAAASSSSDDGEELDTRALGAVLAQKALRIRLIEADGSCLFRAIADQLHGDQDAHHEAVRARAVRYMREQADAFAPFVADAPFAEYCARMALPSTWGGNLELQALSMAFKLHIRIHQVGAPCYDIVNAFGGKVGVTSVHLSYHYGQHYNSVRRVGEDYASEEPAGHAPLYKNAPASFTGRAVEDDEGEREEEAKALAKEEPALVVEVRSRKQEIDEIVQTALRVLISYSLHSSASHVAGGSKLDGDGSELDSEGVGRIVTVCRKRRKELENVASDARERACDALQRALRICHLQTSDGEEIEPAARAKKGIYRLLDAGYELAKSFQEDVERCGQPPDADASLPVHAKRPSKKKVQRAKIRERKTRRIRQQERSAQETADAAASVPESIESQIEEVAII